MGAASERYERAALHWVIHGAPRMARQGVPMDGVREFDRSQFAAALRASWDACDPRWFDDMLQEREHCASCGQSWRLESCRICTECGTTFAPCCPETHTYRVLPNGNAACPKCGNGELVG